MAEIRADLANGNAVFEQVGGEPSAEGGARQIPRSGTRRASERGERVNL